MKTLIVFLKVIPFITYTWVICWVMRNDPSMFWRWFPAWITGVVMFALTAVWIFQTVTSEDK